MPEEKRFTEEGIKALEKMAQEGAQDASGALSQLINQTVNVSTMHVRSIAIEKISEFISDPEDQVATIVMYLSGDVNGQIMLIYPMRSAINVADFLAKRPLGNTSVLDELDKSALKESGNIIAGSFLASVSNYLDVNMLESIPDLKIDMLKATVDAATARFAGSKTIESIAIEVNFGMETPQGTAAIKVVPDIETKGYFILLLDLESAEKVMHSLKGISGGMRMMKRRA
jgi:chemotaxis protein CheC